MSRPARTVGTFCSGNDPGPAPAGFFYLSQYAIIQHDHGWSQESLQVSLPPRLLPPASGPRRLRPGVLHRLLASWVPRLGAEILRRLSPQELRRLAQPQGADPGQDQGVNRLGVSAHHSSAHILEHGLGGVLEGCAAKKASKIGIRYIEGFKPFWSWPYPTA